MSLAEIESAISRLSTQELADLVAWIKQHHDQAWDAQIEADLESGRLDQVLAQVDAECQAGLARPL